MTRSPLLHALAGLLLAGFVLVGCYTTAEPSFHPGNQRDVLAALMLRGLEVTDPVAGETACADPDLVGNSLFFTVRLPGEDAARDVYVHSYRERSWEASKAEVDDCQAAYAAAHPGSDVTRLDVPLYRVFGADWSDEFAEELRRALEDAAEAGRIEG